MTRRDPIIMILDGQPESRESVRSILDAEGLRSQAGSDISSSLKSMDVAVGVVLLRAALHLIHHRDVAVQADDAGSPFGGGAAVPDAGSVMRVQRQRHRAAQGAEVELQWFVAGCHGERSQLDREPPASACSGRQSVNKPK